LTSLLHKLTESHAGRITVIAVAIAVLALLAFELRGMFGTSPEVAAANDRVFICSETGKSWHHTLKDGEAIPIYSSYSGSNTGYPAELCYWTADGKPRKEPTPVLLNSSIGKPEPTFCPDCGRLVVGHNPMPAPGRQPPPTQAEMEARSAGAAGTTP
jgi:hypothetical protein